MPPLRPKQRVAMVDLRFARIHDDVARVRSPMFPRIGRLRPNPGGPYAAETFKDWQPLLGAVPVDT
jgi:hypothetical protein